MADDKKQDKQAQAAAAAVTTPPDAPVIKHEPKLWTDESISLWSALRKERSGMIQKPDMDQLIDFAISGQLFYSRRIPNHATRLGKEHEAAALPQISSIMQMLAGFLSLAQWQTNYEFTDNLREAAYVIYVGWKAGEDMSHDACLWIFDPRKMQTAPSDFVGSRFAFKHKGK